VIVDLATLASCSVATGERVAKALCEAAEGVHAFLAASPTTVEILSVAEVDVAAGAGFRFSLTTKDPRRPYASGPGGIYLIGNGSRALWMVCSAPTDPPVDDWLAIAEITEFLPA
jgi:hypothetical protein